MSSIDERVVNLKFNNGQFEAGARQSLSTLQKLKSALNLDSSSKGLDNLQKASKSFSMANVANNVQTVADRFSALGIIGDQVLRRLTNSAMSMGKNLITAIPNQIISGGKRRAQNIEQAQFTLKGLLKENYDWDKISEDLDYAVSGTAYGLDAAAKVAAQLKASNIAFGDEMKQALRGVSGVAAMTNSSYEDIGHIFTTIAGQGRVMTEQLNQFAGRGLNVAAELAKKFNVSEAELREMVTKGKVDFKTFATAMNEAFGEQATKANETFSGALSNVKASLSRMGAQFAIPGYENLRKVLVALIPVLKDVEKFIKPISAAFTEFAQEASASAVSVLQDIHSMFAASLGLEGGDFTNAAGTFTKAFDTIHKNAIKTVTKSFGYSARMVDDLTSGQERSVDIYEAAKKSYNDIIKQKEEYIKAGKDELLVNKDADKALADLKTKLEEYEKATSSSWHISEESTKAIKESKTTYGKVVSDLEAVRKETLALFNVETAENEQIKAGTENYKNFADIVHSTISTISGGKENLFAASTGLDKKDLSVAVNNAGNALSAVGKNTEKLFSYGSLDGLITPEKQLTAEVERNTAAYKAAEKAYEDIEKRSKELIKAGADEVQVNKEKEAAIKHLQDSLKSFNDQSLFSLDVQTKTSKGQSATAKLYESSKKTVEGLRDKVFDLLGIEKEENAQLQANAKEYEGLEELAQDVILGKYGNGEARKKALEELGFSYAIIQNRVNELLGVSKRYEVTAEDEAKMSKLLGESIGEAGEEAKKTETTFQKTVNILAGIGAALSIVKNFAGALTNNIIKPFLSWAMPKVLYAVLTPLSGLGKKLVEINEKITDSDFFNVKFKAIADGFVNIKDKVIDFFGKAKDLGGVKKLGESLIRLKDAAKSLWDSALSKVTGGMKTFGESIKLPDMEFFLGLLDSITDKISKFIDYIVSNSGNVSGFFSSIFDGILNLGQKGGGFLKNLLGIGDSSDKSMFDKPLSLITDFKTKALAAFGITKSGSMGNGGMFGIFSSFGDGTKKLLSSIGLSKISKATTEEFAAIQVKIDSLTRSFGVITDGAKTFIDKISGIKDVISNALSNVGESGGNIFKFVIDSAKNLGNDLFEKAKDWGKKILDGINEGLKLINFENIAKVLKIGGLTFLGLNLGTFLGGLGKALKTFSSVPKTITGTLRDVSDAIHAYQTDAKANILLKIAAAIAVFAASLIALTFVDSTKLYNVIGALSVFALVIGGLMIAFQAVRNLRKVIAPQTLNPVAQGIQVFMDGLKEAFSKAATLVGIGLMFLGIAGAVLVIAKAIEALGLIDWSKSWAAVGVLIIIVGALSVIVAKLSKYTKDIGVGTGLAFIGLAYALKVLVDVMMSLKGLKFSDVKDALLIMGAIALGVGLLSIASKGNNMIKLAASLLLLSVGLVSLLGVLLLYSAFPFETLAKGLEVFNTVVGALFMLEIGSGIANFLGKGSSFADTAAGILEIAISMLVLAPALILVGQHAADAGMGLLVFGGALAIMLVSAAIAGSVEAIGTGLEKLSKSIILISTAALIGAVALPLLAEGFVAFGTALINNTTEMIAGIVSVIAIIGVLAAISSVAGKMILPLGIGVLALAGGIALLIAIGKGLPVLGAIFDGIFTGIGGALSGMAGMVGALIGQFDLLKKEAPSYTTSLELFNNALGDMKFLSDDVKEELGKQIEALGTLDGSEYTIAVENLMAYIDGLNLPPEQRAELIAEVIKEIEGDASEKHTVALHNIEVAISRYNIPPEKRKELMTLIAELGNLKSGSYSTTVDEVTALITTFDIPEDQKQKLVTAVEEVAKSGAEYATTLEKVDVALTKAEVDDEGKQKVRDAIKNIGKLLAEGKSEDSEEVQAEIEKINVALAENGSAEWTPETRKALDDLIKDAYKSESALEASVEKLDVTLDDLDVKGDVKQQFKTKVEELLALAQNGESEGEEYYIAYHAAVKLLTDQGVDETEARALLSNYSIEAGDAVTAKFTAIKIALENATFGDTDENGFSQERENLKKQAEEMMKLDGVELQAAIEKFNLDLTNSTIDDSSEQIIAQMGRDAGNIFASGYNEELAGVIEQIEALRRAEFIGSFTVDPKSGSYITNKSTLAKEIKSEFKGVEEATDEAVLDFAKHIHDQHYSIEDIIASFGNMGMSDQELAELLFPGGESAGLDTAAFAELVRPMIQAYIEGADDTFKAELAKYGSLDFSRFFNIDPKQANNPEALRAYQENINDGLQMVKERLQLHEQDKLTAADFIGFMDGLDEDVRRQFGTALSGVYENIAAEIEEREANGETREEIIASLSEEFENSLYKAGDGIDGSGAEQVISEKISETAENGANSGVEQAEATLGKDTRLKDLLNNFLSGGEGAVDAEAEIKLGLDLGDFSPEDIRNTILNGKDSLGVELPAGVTLEGIADSVTAGFTTPEVLAAESAAGENLVGGINSSVEGQSSTFNAVMAALGLDGFTGFADFFDMHSPSKLMEGAGLNIVQGLANGVNSAIIIAKVAMITLASNCLTALSEYIDKFRIAGVDDATSFANGLSSTTDQAASAGRSVGDSAEGGIREKIGSAYGLGQDFGDGYVQGVESRRGEAYDAGYDLGIAAKQGMQAAQNSNSPSKVAMGLGGDFGMGYIIGIDAFAKKAGKSAAGVADSALKGLRNPMKAIQNVLNSDMDMDPVIRPVLDLSEIQNGAKMIGRIMPAPNLDLGYVSASLSDVRDPNSEVVSAIMGLTNKVGQPKGDTYNINGITYDDGSNITSAVQTLIHAAKVERRR